MKKEDLKKKIKKNTYKLRKRIIKNKRCMMGNIIKMINKNDDRICKCYILLLWYY